MADRLPLTPDRVSFHTDPNDVGDSKLSDLVMGLGQLSENTTYKERILEIVNAALASMPDEEIGDVTAYVELDNKTDDPYDALQGRDIEPESVARIVLKAIEGQSKFNKREQRDAEEHAAQFDREIERQRLDEL